MPKKNAVKQQQQLIDQDVKDVLGDTGLAQTNSILRTLNDINKKNAILVVHPNVRYGHAVCRIYAIIKSREEENWQA